MSMSCDIFECYNYGCLFRVNDLPVEFHCECVACPNRWKSEKTITTNKTMTNDQLMAYAAKFRKGN